MSQFVFRLLLVSIWQCCGQLLSGLCHDSVKLKIEACLLHVVSTFLLSSAEERSD